MQENEDQVAGAKLLGIFAWYLGVLQVSPGVIPCVC